MKRALFIIMMIFAALSASADTSVSYTYDVLNRLTKVKYSNGVTVSYTYDALGNRTKKTVTATNNLRGDVNNDGDVAIDDITSLIDYLLTGNSSSINLSNADCDQDGNVNIGDVTALIDRLLTGHW